MSDISIDEILSEEAFATLLGGEADLFLRLCNTARALDAGAWNRGLYFQLFSEAEALEAYLDDHGARANRTFQTFRELVASVRGFALAGFAVRHMRSRLESYPLGLESCPDLARELVDSIEQALAFLRDTLRTLLGACRREAERIGVRVPSGGYPEDRYSGHTSRRRLPENAGEDSLGDDRQKVAEIASRYVRACERMAAIGIRAIEDPEERERFFERHASEERARVLEASVHNLQSAYDTHLKGTALESNDGRIPRLRGHCSAAFHLLEAVTALTHFVERHEGEGRQDEAEKRIRALVPRDEVRAVTLSHLLVWAWRLMDLGRPVAEELARDYSNLSELVLELPDDMVLHARPASLIVGIVQHHGLPVTLEIGDAQCNAGSIIETMIAVGSHPDSRHIVFRGDAAPLRDIELLFRHGLGERGVQSLPPELGYLSQVPRP